ncbi:MAG: hypothetical protein V9G08_06180 [Dermatophilaceae bacterium]
MILTYRYFHLMFAFTMTHGYTYLLATLTDQGWATRPISTPEAQQILGAQPLAPSTWKRFSLFGLLGVIALLVAFSVLTSALRRR